MVSNFCDRGVCGQQRQNKIGILSVASRAMPLIFQLKWYRKSLSEEAEAET